MFWLVKPSNIPCFDLEMAQASEHCSRKVPRPKREGLQAPRVFGCGTSKGTPLIMVAPRTFAYNDILLASQAIMYHGKYTALAFTNTDSFKFNIQVRDVERMFFVWIHYSLQPWIWYKYAINKPWQVHHSKLAGEKIPPRWCVLLRIVYRKSVMEALHWKHCEEIWWGIFVKLGDISVTLVTWVLLVLNALVRWSNQLATTR